MSFAGPFLALAATSLGIPVLVLWISPHRTTPLMVAITAVALVIAVLSVAGAWLSQIEEPRQ